jgi:hypothetical protein
MANDVFANGREISCKSGSGKTVCAFPDVCFTPPENPATPPGVPIPYPNTGMDQDTTNGSKTVKITGKEVMLKNKSYYKTSYGDEAGCAAKKGVITSVNRGKVYFTSWSMDVKFEGENVDRHMDLSTHNHASEPPQTPPWMHVDEMAVSVRKSCEKEIDNAETACKGKSRTKCGDACRDAQKCLLIPKSADKKSCCEPETTGHHLIEVHCFSPTGLRGSPLEGLENYNQNKAPCVCASESRADGTHGLLHAIQGRIEGHYEQTGTEICSWLDPDGKGRTNVSKWRYKHARDAGVKAHKIAFPQCSEECTKAQLDAYHKDECGIHENSPVRTDSGAEDRSSGTLTPAQKAQITKYLRS